MALCPSCGEENPDRFRLCGFCGTPLAPVAPPQEVRKTVTIVFSDLKGSTSLGEALDSESLREVMTRYFEEMRRILESHGGTIEKFIGDAVMAVFGLPKLHEDDALRAVRAAYEMQQALAALNVELEQVWGVRLENRTGVNTGEVVAGDPTGGQRLVVGDAVNVAARLEQAAGATEVLLGDLTYNLVRDAVEADPVEPLTLKGKSEPVPAYRLLGVQASGDGYARQADAPLVGRSRELEALRAAFDEAVALRACRLVSPIADAGVGKSRLVESFLASLDGEAAVARGRCLPYGSGITFWPLVEVTREAAGIAEEDAPDAARTKLAGLVAPPDEAVVARVAAAIGLSGEQFPIEELFWGIRKLLESLARDRVAVVVFDDVHWAEPAFLDLVEHLVESVQDAPLLLLCPSRPDLLERRPAWAEGASARRLPLAPLSEAETERIVENLLGRVEIAPEVRRRIVNAAEGNPLFAEQLLSMLVDGGYLRLEDGRWRSDGELSELEIPPTIHALLSARLDHLAAEERAVVEPGSVIGLAFPQAAVEELVWEALRPRVAELLGTLSRKQFVRPQPGEELAYRFGHLLIRDATYQGLLKRTRAKLHEQFVDWADRVNRERNRAAEYEEILGYHLEQAYRYLAELGPLDDHGRELGRRAAERLASAGRRAFGRGDMNAASGLLDRAAALLPPDDPQRLALLPALGEALIDVGDFARAQELLEEGLARADAAGDERLAAEIRLGRLLVRFFGADPESWGGEAEREAGRAIEIFEAAGDDAALAKAWRLLASVHGRACRFEDEAKAGRRAMEHARRAGDRRQELRSAAAYAMSTVYGPTPVPAALAECERILGEARGDRRTEGLMLGSLARLHALDGDFERARQAYRRAREVLEDLGTNVLAASLSLDSHAVELLAGDPAAAERELRRDYDALDAMGEKYLLSTIAGLLAEALCAQGRYDEANAMCMITASAASEDDPQSQALWRSVRAKVLARRKERAHALELGREAVEILRRTDALLWQADALVDLADVLLVLGDEAEARRAVEEAASLYERKGSAVAAARARSALASPATSSR